MPEHLKLDASPTWHETESTFTHPEYVDAAFLLHDLGVLELSEPVVLPEYGSLPEQDYLDRYAGKNRQRGLFESVGYGLEDSGPKFGLGGDTRRKADRRLVSLKGAYGYRDIAVMFSHRGSGTTGGTCFGDSGGPTFDITTSQIADDNIIVAVTSFGLNAYCRGVDFAYRTDQQAVLDWIRATVGESTRNAASAALT